MDLRNIEVVGTMTGDSYGHFRLQGDDEKLAISQQAFLGLSAVVTTEPLELVVISTVTQLTTEQIGAI